MKIRLTEDDFKTLVEGGEVKIYSPEDTYKLKAQIILADIGHDRMIRLIADAMAKDWLDIPEHKGGDK